MLGPMKPFKRFGGPVRLVVALALSCVGAALLHGQEPGRRILVQVPNADIGGRPRDEGPAEFRLDLQALAPGRRLDPATLRVVRWDATQDRAASSPLPLRWYDDAIPYDFPECEQYVSQTDGKALRFEERLRWGDFYNVLGDGLSG